MCFAIKIGAITTAIDEDEVWSHFGTVPIQLNEYKGDKAQLTID
jgi:hypothetical protein